MDYLDEKQTRARLGYPDLAQAIAAVLNDASARAPVRTALALAAGGTLLVMPAADDAIAMTKVVTVHPDNARHDLATIQGEMVVMDAATGVRCGVLDGATVSGRRTAAVSLLAAERLAPEPTAPLLIVGAGVQARTHLDAFRDGLATETVYIASRTRNKAEALADYARGHGMTAAVVAQPREAIDNVGLIATTTTSTEPVLPDTLPSNVFVAAVGAFNPDMAELSPALVGAATVIVDTLAGAHEEAGDLIQAAEAGAFDWHSAQTLAAAVAATDKPAGPVVFKSVGSPLWDLAAARCAFA